MNHDYCPDENDRFFQYPIGGHRFIEQIQPIIEFNDRVNFTAIEIGSIEHDTIIFIGDDNGTVYTVDIFALNFVNFVICFLKLSFKLRTQMKFTNKTLNPRLFLI